jgi:ATP-dependent helicase/nuclease subunit A
MAWLRSADTEVKRDMEITRDEVRVMTVHGAKGLEASVVFMVDTTSSPADSQRVRLIHVPRGNGGEVVVWAGRKADDPKPVVEARKAMLEETEDEYRRLLYVAMTRAADRLIVGGCLPGNMRTVRKLSWYDLVDTGLTGSGLEKETIETPLGKVTRFVRPGDVATLGTPATAVDHSIALPAWLRVPAPRETVDDDPVRPSGQSAEVGRAVRTGESVQSRALALQRGTLVHRLLQSLPDIAIERRREAALGFMARNASDWTEPNRSALADRVLALITEPRFAPVFAAGSRAEVAIVGKLDRPGRTPALVSGQIDRLVVRPDEVLIVDFKTNQTAPKSAAEAPATYVRQLALYRAVLSRLYPQKPIRAVLLWTEALEYMEISAPALDAALASLHAGVSVLDPARGRS